MINPLDQAIRLTPDDERIRLVSNAIARTDNQLGASENAFLKYSLQMDLRRILNKQYDAAISSLIRSIRETQAPAAYLLLSEAYLRSGDADMAMITLDVLRCVEPDYPEADLMKKLLFMESRDYAEAYHGFHSQTVEVSDS